jgi:hypothetical protein
VRWQLPRPGPSRVVAGTTVVALATGATGWLIGAQVQSPADAAAAHRPPPASLVTVAVERRALTASVTAQGTVGYGAPRQLSLSGTVAGEDGQAGDAQLITKAPTAGRTLREGDVLLEVSGRPVFVFTGTVPMYRTLRRSSSGDDVRQLRGAMRRLLPARNLAADGPFNDNLTAAVQAWYAKRGYQATGPTPEQRAQLRQLEQAATEVGTGSNETETGAGVRAGAGEPRAGGGGGQALADAKADLAAFRKTYGVSVASGEILFLPKLPTRIDTVTAKAGAEASGPIGTVADPRLVIKGEVPEEDADLLKKGMAATLSLTGEGSFGATLTGVGGAVAASKAAQADSAQAGTEGETEQELTGTAIRLEPKRPKQLARYAGQAFKIVIRVGSTGEAVLAVPLAAVFTSAAGDARLSVQTRTGETREVPITTGLSTGGYVQVTAEEGSRLTAGDRAVVGTD